MANTRIRQDRPRPVIVPHHPDLPVRSAPAEAVEDDPQTQFNHDRTQTHVSFEQAMDKEIRAALARFTGGLSPIALASAYADWALHLAASPGKQIEIVEKAVSKVQRLGAYARSCALAPDQARACIDPLPQDRRFRDQAWQQWPFNVMSQAFLLHQQWWHNATTDVAGVTDQHEKVVTFTARQILDVFSPSNFALTNPEILARTFATGGTNLLRGYQNFLEDTLRADLRQRPVGNENFCVGQTVAATAGKIVFRNRLVEVIQYAPSTDKVRPEPVLIVPAWIMKYYILDLSEHNSLVRYLTAQGFTVFMISWKNPDAEDRDLGLQDYLSLGIDSAVRAVDAITGGRRAHRGIHALGYCLGGTLLSIAAAAMARDGDKRLHSMSLLAAQIDFTEAGELTLFINDSQLAFLEDMMWEKGYLDARQMAGAFQLLRSNDLIWSRLVHDYLMGDRSRMTDMMAWNADATRMPYRMHSEYLRSLFLDNDFAEGRYRVGGEPVALTDIRMPVFVVGTESDHVAPWKSVYKFNLMSDTEVTFALTNGGHNAGIVSEPGHKRRHYRIRTKTKDAPFIDPERWLAETPAVDGSWWPELAEWLARRSGNPVAPPPMGAAAKGYAPLCDAPGTFVLQQ